MGEVVKPGSPIRGDLPLRPPIGLPQPGRPGAAGTVLIELVCGICGERFASLYDAFKHQEATGHACFRLVAVEKRPLLA